MRNINATPNLERISAPALEVMPGGYKSEKDLSKELKKDPKIKQARAELARAKAAFSGKYKISYDAALEVTPDLLKMGNRFLQRIAGKEVIDKNKALEILTDDAQERLQDITEMQANLEELWNQKLEQMKAPAVPVDDTLTPHTLRSYFMEVEGMNKADAEEKTAKVFKHIRDIDAVAAKPIEHVEELGDEEIEEVEETPATIKAEPAPEALKPEAPKKIDKSPRERAGMQYAQELFKEKPSAEQMKNEVLQEFGGNEKARERAARMWDDAHVKLAMIERSGILRPGEKVGMDALEYVHANAKMQLEASRIEKLMAQAQEKLINDSIESFGGDEAGREKGAEIWDLANEMMGNEKSEAEIAREYGFTRMEYVEAWADLSNAYRKMDEDMIDAMKLRVFNMTKKLLGKEGGKLTQKRFDKEWDLLSGSGRSRLLKMRGLSGSRALAEQQAYAEKATGMPGRRAEGARGRGKQSTAEIVIPGAETPIETGGTVKEVEEQEIPVETGKTIREKDKDLEEQTSDILAGVTEATREAIADKEALESLPEDVQGAMEDLKKRGKEKSVELSGADNTFKEKLKTLDNQAFNLTSLPKKDVDRYREAVIRYMKKAKDGKSRDAKLTLRAIKVKFDKWQESPANVKDAKKIDAIYKALEKYLDNPSKPPSLRIPKEVAEAA
ncbi:MAG: hypothetical protein ACOYUZ_03220 [Patescibacteria group bacterium]